jgi:hypothetical protein
VIKLDFASVGDRFETVEGKLVTVVKIHPSKPMFFVGEDPLADIDGNVVMLGAHYWVDENGNHVVANPMEPHLRDLVRQVK